MKVKNTPQGNVKIILSNSEATKLKAVLGETTPEWLAEETDSSLADARELEAVSAEVYFGLDAAGI